MLNCVLNITTKMFLSGWFDVGFDFYLRRDFNWTFSCPDCWTLFVRVRINGMISQLYLVILVLFWQ
jgi:hypothetical protein